MLHIVKSPSALNDMVALYKDGDQILLIEDAVYASNAQHAMFPILKARAVFVLEADAKARGVLNRVSPSCHLIDYPGFVDLSAVQANSLTWN